MNNGAAPYYSGTKHWYLVYCKPRQERTAKINLERQGYRTYLPLIRLRRRRKGKRVVSVEPMFPRYLFISLDVENQNWSPIRSTLGVASLVRFGQDPARVPAYLVNLMIERQDNEGVQELPDEQYRHGDTVRIMEGPMSGYQGIFLAHSGRDRVIVLLNIMGQHARVQVSTEQIEAGG